MSQHADTVKTYALIWVALLALTGITTAVAFVDLGGLSVFAALAIASFKMILVALYFMHVRHSASLTKLVVVGGLLWLAILVTFTMADYASRNWLGIALK